MKNYLTYCFSCCLMTNRKVEENAQTPLATQFYPILLTIVELLINFIKTKQNTRKDASIIGLLI